MKKMVLSTGIKLEGSENWTVWRFQMKVLLRAMDLFSVVDGSEAKPVEAAALASWTAKDSKAQGILVTHLQEKIMVHVITTKSAEEMWKKLHTVFERTSATSLHLEQQKFLAAKCDDYDISVFFAKIEEIRNKIAQLGEQIPDKMVITKIITSLPESYKHFIAAWESVAVANQTIDELQARLLVEEERIRNGESREAQQETKTVAFAGRSLANTMKCTACGKTGHGKADCRSVKGLCHYCKKPGHFFSECRKRISKLGKKGQQSPNQSSGQRQDKSNAFVANFETQQNWVLDTGASEHMCHTKELFVGYEPLKVPKKIVIGDSSELSALGQGVVAIRAHNGTEWIQTTLNDVLYVPKIAVNLFSARSAMDRGYEMTLDNKQCRILKKGETVALGCRRQKLYVMNFSLAEQAVLAAQPESLASWHQRLGHQNLGYVKDLLKQRNVEFRESSDSCEGCMKGKMHKQPFNRSETKTTRTCELVHMDSCGPMETTSIGGSKYFLLIKDDFSRYKYVYFLTNKSEVTQNIKTFIKIAERETGNKIKTIRTDKGKEFVNKEMKQTLEENGIRHQTSITYTPEQNGKIERENRTIIEAARSMIYAKNLEKKLWAGRYIQPYT